MLSDEELEPLLNGSLGVAALDAARELLSLRVQLSHACAERDRLLSEVALHQDHAECARGEVACAKERMEALCTALANIHAGLREYLGAKQEQSPGETDAGGSA